MNNLLILQLIWTISSASDCVEPSCTDTERCILARCITMPTSDCVEPCTDTQICVGSQCISLLCKTPCVAPEECVAGQCINVAAVLPSVGVTDTICTAFENCQDFTEGCNECTYDPATGITTCESLTTDVPCTVDTAPPNQCTNCIDGHVLADYEGATCCIVSDSVRVMGVEISIMELAPQIDTNSDGYIDGGEFTNFASLLSTDILSPEEAVALFNALDTNNDDKLSIAELQAGFLALAQFIDANVVQPDVVQPDVIQPVVIETDEVNIEASDVSDRSDGSNAGAMTNDNNNIVDMFGIKDATAAETYSILTVIIVAGVVVLVVLTWGVYQCTQKRKALNELNEMEENQNRECDIDEKPLYQTEIVTDIIQTRD